MLKALAALLQQSISFNWRIRPLLFQVPDISMLGYFISFRKGTICYKLFYHKRIALALLLSGYLTYIDMPLLIGILLYANNSFDRVTGYGLNYRDSFNNTYLAGSAKLPKMP